MGFWAVFGGPRAGFWEGKSLEKASRKSLKFRWIFGRGFSRILAPNWEPKPSPGGSFLALETGCDFLMFYIISGGFFKELEGSGADPLLDLQRTVLRNF